MKKAGQRATEISDTSQVEEEEENGATRAYLTHLQHVQAELNTQDLSSLAEQEHPKSVSLMILKKFQNDK